MSLNVASPTPTVLMFADWIKEISTPSGKALLRKEAVIHPADPPPTMTTLTLSCIYTPPDRCATAWRGKVFSENSG
jgi:hypothetical protein